MTTTSTVGRTGPGAAARTSGMPVPLARGVRTGVLASTSLTVGAVAHATAGGHVPGTPSLVVLGALTVALCALVARARSRVLVLVPFLALLQLVLHHGFMLAGAMPGGAAGSMPAMAGEHTAQAGHGVGAAMLVTHAAAVVVTAVLLAATERAARLAIAVWTWLLPALLGILVPVPPARPATVPFTARGARTLQQVLRSVAPRRGPPSGMPTVA
ncbi:hypothetical protein [Cellulosimicrobium arenosum]|uniref:Uncharacterized protein n=1 Tax=Cellulosimicrobium arenosum TaxID=2708133 RepID=A0A927J0H3_9MICO|nr:hypothetical protein [Cellulosimicrobium arenosum]MBD8079611.1 hypothetical protein [Cellulosimicrobium arenosum]